MWLARVVLFRLRESPSWLVSVGRRDEAADVLSQIAEVNGQSHNFTASHLECGESDPAKMHDSYPPPQADEPPAEHWRTALQNRLSILLQHPMRTTTILVWAIWTLVAAAYT